MEQPEQAMVLLNPLRQEILNRLAEPASASEVARALREVPQRINYHLKTLEKAGLVRRVGTRQVRNLTEVLYQAIARTFILPESLGWNEETVQRIKDQGSLSHLLATSERIKRDALLLMERADKEEVPSATMQFAVSLAGEEERHAFVQEYLTLVEELVTKYQGGKATGESYQVVLAVYPQTPQGGEGT